MTSRLEIVQRIKHYFKASKPFDVKLYVLNIGVVRDNLDVRVEYCRRLLCYLTVWSVRHYTYYPVRSIVCSYQGFGFPDMFVSEEELSVQIAQVDCVEVDDVNFAEAGEGEIF